MRKGISPAVSYVLLLALIVIMSVGAYLWGDYEVRRLQDTPIAHNMESQMISVDELVQAAAHGDVNFTATMSLYYTKGVVEVDAANNWIKYTAELNSQAYGTIDAAERDDGCDAGTISTRDTITAVRMTKMDNYTNVFRGGTAYDQRQLVEIVACFPAAYLELRENPSCVGKSGPRARLTAKKVDSTGMGVPIVEVSVC